MLRIMHIITGLDGGGTERQLLNLVTGSDQNSVQHSVVSLVRSGIYEEELRRHNIECWSMDLDPGQISLAAFFRLVSVIRKWHPSLVQTWLYHADFAGLLAARFARRAPVVWTLRCSELPMVHFSYLTRFLRRLLTVMSCLPAAIIANSEAGMAFHRQLGYRPRLAMVIPNGIDTDLFRPNERERVAARAELGISDGEILVGSIARLDPVKDHQTLFKSMAKTPASIKLLLAGKGTEETNQKLLQRIAEAKLDQRRVIFLGERSDVPRLLAALDVFVLSSFNEGFPNALAEAMACGVPCVATNVGDVAAILQGLGEVVPAQNPDALAQAIVAVTHSGPEQRRAMGVAARAKIAGNYSIPVMVENYMMIYRHILGSVNGSCIVPNVRPQSHEAKSD